MLGNDIVDLSLATEQSNWQRKGFLRKLFSDKEIDLIYDSEKPDLMVWRLWTMKESSYKADFRSSKKRKFNPRKFQCELVDKAKGYVQYEGHIYKTNSLIKFNFIHTSSWHSRCNSNLSEPKIETFKKQVSSAKLYQSLIFNVALSKGYKEEDLQIIKTTMGVPEIYKDQRKIETLCSISHHGRYGAFIIMN